MKMILLLAFFLTIHVVDVVTVKTSGVYVINDELFSSSFPMEQEGATRKIGSNFGKLASV